MKYCWFDINTGEFSNSWDQKTQDFFIKDSDYSLENNTGFKLIKFECLNDEKFEFQNIMKIVTNTKNLGLKK